jgi:hypothetical protein
MQGWTGAGTSGLGGKMQVKPKPHAQSLLDVHSQITSTCSPAAYIPLTVPPPEPWLLPA